MSARALTLIALLALGVPWAPGCDDGSDGDADADTDGDTDTDSDSDGDGDVDGDGDTDTDTDTDADTDVDGDGDADEDEDEDGGDADADEDADVEPPLGCHPSATAAPFVLDDSLCVAWRATLAAPATAVLLAGEAALVTYEWEARHLSLVTVDAAAGAEETRVVVSTFEPTLEDTMYFPSQFVAGHAARSVAVGYTVVTDFGGELFAWPEGSATPVALPAPGNYSAAWLTGSVLLVNGLGLGAASGGEALYAATVAASGASSEMALVTGLHDASAPTAAGGGLVVTGGNDFSTNHLYAFTTAELEAAFSASTALDAATAGDEVYTGPVAYAGGAVALVGPVLFVATPGDWPAAFATLLAVPLATTDDSVAPGAQLTAATLEAGAVLDTFDMAAAGRVLALHFATTSGEVQTHEVMAIIARP